MRKLPVLEVVVLVPRRLVLGDVGHMDLDLPN